MADGERQQWPGGKWFKRIRKGLVSSASMRMPYLAGAAHTDAGPSRSNNEDACLLAELGPDNWLAAVADGVGGHERGEEASQYVIEALQEQLGSIADSLTSPEEGVGLLKQALVVANRELADRNRLLEGKGKMGTTLTCLWMKGEYAMVGHVGDSRLYRWRDGILERLTVDQTKSGRLFAEGLLTEEEERAYPGRNVIEQALGIPEDRFQPDGFPLGVREGDRYLICSDGLNNGLLDDQIAEILQETHSSYQEHVSHLVNESISRSGRDNTTAVLFDVYVGGEEGRGK